MISLRAVLLLTVALAPVLNATAQTTNPREKGQPFRLAAGDFRWIPFAVHQTPAEVYSRFEVVAGGPAVHIELLPMDQFRLFDRGERHSALAVTPPGRDGALRRTINLPGDYAVVVVNARDAAPATVTLRIQTRASLNGDTIARTLPPQRRLTVILVSFLFFFVTVAWAGWKLMRAMHNS